MAQQDTLRIGTRGSPLALAQTGQVIAALAEKFPRLGERRATETVVIKTSGDRLTGDLLATFGGKGLFTKELDEALLRGEIDIAVHSMKDMPTHVPDGILASAVLKREDPRDAFISSAAKSLDDLPQGARVGTASLRRAAQVRRRRPDIAVVPLRGNVDTRLRKIAEGEADATFLAVAGLKRLGREAEITATVSAAVMLPAVGQGALCATCRADDANAAALLAAVSDGSVTACVMAERAMLVTLDGSCRTPIAALAEMSGTGTINLRGMLAHPKGTEVVEAAISGPAADAERLGVELAEELTASASPALFRAIEEARPEIIEPHPEMEQET